MNKSRIARVKRTLRLDRLNKILARFDYVDPTFAKALTKLIQG